jgi:hypothetical protein
MSATAATATAITATIVAPRARKSERSDPPLPAAAVGRSGPVAGGFVVVDPVVPPAAGAVPLSA